jgi:hypothetical protein
MTFKYNGEGPGFVVPTPLEDRTVELSIVRSAAPVPIAPAPADATLAALLAAVDTHPKEIRRLAATPAVAATRERVQFAIADLQQLDAHLAEAEGVKRDASQSKFFQDWATAPGGERG